MGISGDIALILVSCLLCALVIQRLGFPLILGYILGGVLVGPETGGPTISNLHDIELLADIGVALLLFTVGLEFPMEKLKVVKGISLVGAPLQMLAVGLWGMLIAKMMGWDSTQGIWFGALISISSTMVVLKVLMSKGLMETLSSKVMLGILVVQDLAVVPLMILLPALGDPEAGLSALGVAFVRAVLFVGMMTIFGTRALPRLLDKVVAKESRELFVVVVIGIGLGVGYATYLVGLSFAFGAFLAGLVLSRSPYSHDALTDMIPLREVFSLLFFASVGMLLSPKYLAAHFTVVLLLCLAVLVGKGFLMAVITRAFGYKRIIPLAVGLSMPQVGEFSFVLARVGRESGGLQEDVYYIVISVAVLTMALTPFSSAPASRLYDWWVKRQPTDLMEREEQISAEGRVVLIGYRRHGELIGNVLKEAGHAPLVIDLDFDQAQHAREAGLDSVCAEATSPEFLERSALNKAKLVIVAVSDILVSRSIIEHVTRGTENPPNTVLMAPDVEHYDLACEMGVSQVILAPLETGLEMIHQSLLLLEYGEEESHAVVDAVRRNRYEVSPGLR
ncbi:MAG: cation:proton antiporter, partial [Vulcanimicrobiota bacterium]